MLREIEPGDFERLTERFFGRGFATLTKTEVEVYLFDIYMRGVERLGDAPSYYTIGRELGITESRARALSEKRSLFFDEPPSVKKCLRYLLEHAPKDMQDGVIRIQVTDVNILRALQDHIESRELGVEPELSGKAFRVTIKTLFILLDDHFGRAVTTQAFKKVCGQTKEAKGIVDLVEARSLTEIVTDPNTYTDLLKLLVDEKKPISFMHRLAQYINEATKPTD